MSTPTVKGINFGSIVVAGFAGGYVMYFVDHWFAGFLGLFGAFPGTSNAWWMLQHHIDGILFALIFAWPLIYNILPGGGWLKGLVFGIAWTVLFAIVAMIAGAAGVKMFQGMGMSAAVIISNFILHGIWGLVVGMLYNPPKGKGEPAAA
jgi:hypothetical protein